MNPIKRYRIAEIRELAPSTKAITLEPVEESIEYTPGQFAFIHLLDENGESILKRPYSIASAPEEKNIEFCIKMIQGQMTGKLENMKPGDILGIQQGGGHFSYKGEENGAFISGGTGIAPIMSILRHVAKTNKEGNFIAFYSARTKDEILYLDELKELQESHKGIKVVITLTREDWEGEKGRICKDMIAKYVPDGSQYTWWVCGPMSMIKVMKECLIELKADPKKLKLEGWG